jgi:hypothetical protein
VWEDGGGDPASYPIVCDQARSDELFVCFRVDSWIVALADNGTIHEATRNITNSLLD